MCTALIHPKEILPHGAGLQLLKDVGQRYEDRWEFVTALEPRSSALLADGEGVPELGLEIMAQAAGVVIAHERMAQAGSSAVAGGVVGAVRGYEYQSSNFTTAHGIRIVVRSDMCDEVVGVCQCELFVDEEAAPRQRARITIILQQGKKEEV